MTGDSEYSQLGGLQQADLILTTPEKWDDVTRRSRVHKESLVLTTYLLDVVLQNC